MKIIIDGRRPSATQILADDGTDLGRQLHAQRIEILVDKTSARCVIHCRAHVEFQGDVELEPTDKPLLRRIFGGGR